MGGSSNLQISDGLYTRQSYNADGGNPDTRPVYNTNYSIFSGGSERNVIAFPRYAVFGMWVKFNPLVDNWVLRTESVSSDGSGVGIATSTMQFDPDPSPPTLTVRFDNEGAAGVPNNFVDHTWDTITAYGSGQTLLDYLQDGWNHIGLEHNKQYVQGGGGDNNDKMTLYINGQSMGKKTESGANQVKNEAHFGKTWTFTAEQGKVCFQQPVIYQSVAGNVSFNLDIVDFDFSDIVGGATSGTPTFVDLGRSGTSGASRTLPTPIIYEIFKHPFTDLRQTNATLTLANSAILYDCKTQNP